MRLEKAAIVVVLTVLVWTVPAVAAGQGFKVVINDSNATTSISKDVLSRCFMKQVQMWISGQPVVPVDQAASSETRKAFSTKIHGRDVSAVKSFWQRQIFSGRGVPPPEKASDEEVLAFVRDNPGAVGYISSSANIGSGVKVLEITGE